MRRNREFLLRHADSVVFMGTVPTHLPQMPVQEPERAMCVEVQAPARAHGEEVVKAKPVKEAEDRGAACEVCSGFDSFAGNELLLCDGCDAGHHMLCLPQPLAMVPAGDWFCPSCTPPQSVFRPTDEHEMELSKGTKLWARDRKDLWGRASIIGVEHGSIAEAASESTAPSAPSGPAERPEPSDGGSGPVDGADPAPEVPKALNVVRVRVTFKGFAKKYDEWIEVGAGRLRPLDLGPPDQDGFEEEFYVVDRVIDCCRKRGRMEYLVEWEGYTVPTWEPRSSFIGPAAKQKLAEFLAEREVATRGTTGDAASETGGCDATADGGAQQPPERGHEGAPALANGANGSAVGNEVDAKHTEVHGDSGAKFASGADGDGDGIGAELWDAIVGSGHCSAVQEAQGDGFASSSIDGDAPTASGQGFYPRRLPPSLQAQRGKVSRKPTAATEGHPCAADLQMCTLPHVAPLPEARSWIFLRSNHPVPDQELTFVPYFGEDDSAHERAKQVQMELRRQHNGSPSSFPSTQPPPPTPPPLRPVSEQTSDDRQLIEASMGNADGHDNDHDTGSEKSSYAHQASRHEAQPLPSDRSVLSSLFCRRCFIYDCALHGPVQPLPRWHYRETATDMFTDADAFLASSTSNGVNEVDTRPTLACTCRLAKVTDALWATAAAADMKEQKQCLDVSQSRGLDTVADSDEELPWEDAACVTCKGFDSLPGNELLLCDSCDAGYHMACLPQPLVNVPIGDWFCPACAPETAVPSNGAHSRSETATAGKSLPPGWTTLLHTGGVRPYSTFRGPDGDRAPSRKEAWRIYSGKKDTAQRPSEPAARPDPILHGKQRRPLTTMLLRLKLEGHRERSGTMCSHDGPCDTSTRDCVCINALNFCETFCACGPSCKNRYSGCKCASDCSTKLCPCFKLGRECDADLCMCSAKNHAASADPPCTKCMPLSIFDSERKPRGRKVKRRGTEQNESLAGDAEGDDTGERAGLDHEGKEVEGDAISCQTANATYDSSLEAQGNEAPIAAADGFPGTASGTDCAAEAARGGESNIDSKTDVKGTEGLSAVANMTQDDRGSDNNDGANADGGRCRNQSIQLRQQLPVLVGPSSVAGWGAFAPHAIEKGAFLSEYLGELISHEEADRRGQVYDRRASSYLFNLNDRQVVDAGRKGNRSRFANHSDAANAATRIMAVRGDHHIGLYAAKPIERGEEIFFDYRYDREERQKFGFKSRHNKRQRDSSTSSRMDGKGGHKRARA